MINTVRKELPGSELPGTRYEVVNSGRKIINGTGHPSSYSLSSTKKVVFGLIIVWVIAASWVGSTQTAKSAYTGSFKAPFFSMWFSTSWMIFLFPLSCPIYFITKKGSVKDLWK